MNRVQKGDTVEVIAGDERGARGVVNQVWPQSNRVIVGGLNLIWKHQRPTGEVRTQVGKIQREAPIHLSNVAPVCKSCDRWTRVGFQVTAEGRKVRVCKRCGEVMD
jgi:large subunit ribosomal protein L24